MQEPAAHPSPARARPTVRDAIGGYFRDFKVLRETRAEYWGTQIVNVLDSTAYFALLNIASVFLSEDVGLSDEAAGYSISLFTTATTILLFFSGTVTDWLGIRTSAHVSILAQGVLRLALAAVGLVPSLPHRGLLATLILLAMAPFMAMVQTVFQSANKRYTTERSRSAGFSLWYLFMNIGAAGGGFLVDAVRKLLGLPNAHIFTAGALLALACSGVALLMIRREDQLVLASGAEEAAAAPAPPRKKPWQIALEVVRERALWRLLALIALILGARAIFSYLYLLFPKYWLRTIGSDAAIGTLQAINPVLIVIGIVLFVPFVNRFSVFGMLVHGAMISSASLLVLALPWQWFSADIARAHYAMSILAMVLLSVGEVVWSPKLYEYTAAVAPPGQEGTYLGISNVPWFLAKTLVSALSGHFLVRWCPEGIGQRMAAGQAGYWESPATMWLALGGYALFGCAIALALRRWFSKGLHASPG